VNTGSSLTPAPFSVLPYSETNLNVDLLLPLGQRSTGTEGTAIHVCFAIDVLLQVGEVS
jgi:hypothetical protein